jgi:hypothetical protein
VKALFWALLPMAIGALAVIGVVALVVGLVRRKD